jgi:hypothetical protein
MSFLQKNNLNYGNKVDGYPINVINEREARAAAGLMFAFGMLSFLNSFMLGNIIFTTYFVTFFMIDFIIRVINPNFSPSMLLGRVFVQNQIPEYTGAIQKRFAWFLGVLLSVPMFYLLVIEPTMTPIKIVICVLCLFLLFFESAFSICLGCIMYRAITKDEAQLCPGGVCEITQKDEIQKFSLFQKSIVLVLIVFTVTALYKFTFETPNNSYALKMLPHMMMSDEERHSMHEKMMQMQMDKEFEDDDFDKEDMEDSMNHNHMNMDHSKHMEKMDHSMHKNHSM